ncbi:hypothetical protein RISK_000149 [Rhodopirellula islandica]|uniref:Uncharacterized protein n=1 Tax=Rhodopirellula islandica TaxID=595434 RepID=A0A0J1BMM9_RHOIS|nr:hypothetical protein RISK_000149 [Rhodopirellula islandica]
MPINCNGAGLIDEKIETRRGGGAEHRGGWNEGVFNLLEIEIEPKEVAVVIVGAAIEVPRRLGLIWV